MYKTQTLTERLLDGIIVGEICLYPSYKMHQPEVSLNM